MKTKLISVLVGVFLVIGGFTLSVRNAQATFNICNTLPWLPQCQPTPSPSPSPSPSVSPSPTPYIDYCPEEGYQPTGPCEEEVYCDDEGALNYKDEGECQYPEPTPTPRVEQPSNPEYSTPTCNGIPAGTPAWVHVDRVDADSIWLQWVNGNDTEKTTIRYGYVGSGLDYSVLDLNSNVSEWTINDLEPNVHVNVQITNWRGQCVTTGPTIDP